MHTRLATGQFQHYSAETTIVKLENIWRSREIEFKLSIRLYNSLVLSKFIYGCETCTLLEESKKKIRGFESKAHMESPEYKL